MTELLLQTLQVSTCENFSDYLWWSWETHWEEASNDMACDFTSCSSEKDTRKIWSIRIFIWLGLWILGICLCYDLGKILLEDSNLHISSQINWHIMTKNLINVLCVDSAELLSNFGTKQTKIPLDTQQIRNLILIQTWKIIKWRKPHWSKFHFMTLSNYCH